MQRRQLVLQSLALLACGRAVAQDKAAAIVRRIDHIQVEPPDPAAMMAALQRDFAWPALWPYAEYGAFSSGGLVLGNVVLEIGRLGRAPTAPGGLNGLALEPALPSAALVAELERRRIGHGPATPFPARPGAPAQWTTTRVDGVAPLRLFFCEYHIDTATGTNAARTVLAQQGGGPLGLRGVQEVAVADDGRSMADTAAAAWAPLLAPSLPGLDGLYPLPAGPAIRVLAGPGRGIRWLLLDVASTPAAAQALRERGFSADPDDGTLYRGEGVLAGLMLRLPAPG